MRSEWNGTLCLPGFYVSIPHTSSSTGRRTLRAVPAFLLLLILVLAGTPAKAQFDAAAVLGTVKDASGAIVPGATVTLTNVAKGVSVEALTDDKGDYQFPVVQIGEYQLMVSKPSFADVTSEKFTVQIGARQRVDMQLRVAGSAQ